MACPPRFQFSVPSTEPPPPMRCSVSTMFLRTSLPTAALALIAAAPAAAAPELTQPVKRCYVTAQENQRELIDIRATGFTPLTPIDVYIDGILQDQPRSNFDGSLSGTVRAPWQESDQRRFSLRLT